MQCPAVIDTLRSGVFIAPYRVNHSQSKTIKGVGDKCNHSHLSPTPFPLIFGGFLPFEAINSRYNNCIGLSNLSQIHLKFGMFLGRHRWSLHKNIPKPFDRTYLFEDHLY